MKCNDFFLCLQDRDALDIHIDLRNDFINCCHNLKLRIRMQRSLHINASGISYAVDDLLPVLCLCKAQIKIGDDRFDMPMKGYAYNVKSDRPWQNENMSAANVMIKNFSCHSE